MIEAMYQSKLVYKHPITNQFMKLPSRINDPRLGSREQDREQMRLHRDLRQPGVELTGKVLPGGTDPVLREKKLEQQEPALGAPDSQPKGQISNL